MARPSHPLAPHDRRLTDRGRPFSYVRCGWASVGLGHPWLVQLAVDLLQDSMMNASIVQHPNAVWANRADTAAVLWQPPDTFRERVPLQTCRNGLYMLCCVPWALYDVSLGDNIRLRDKEQFEVVERGGHRTLRGVLNPAKGYDRGMEVLDAIELVTAAMGGELEYKSNTALFSIDVPNDTAADRMLEYLGQLAESGDLMDHEVAH